MRPTLTGNVGQVCFSAYAERDVRWQQALKPLADFRACGSSRVEERS